MVSISRFRLEMCFYSLCFDTFLSPRQFPNLSILLSFQNYMLCSLLFTSILLQNWEAATLCRVCCTQMSYLTRSDPGGGCPSGSLLHSVSHSQGHQTPPPPLLKNHSDLFTANSIKFVEIFLVILHLIATCQTKTILINFALGSGYAHPLELCLSEPWPSG